MIAHDARAAGLALVYWWDNENEIHGRFFASPLDDPTALVPNDGTGLACVWEMEVLDSSVAPGWRTCSRTTTSRRTSPGALPTPRFKPATWLRRGVQSTSDRRTRPRLRAAPGSSVLSARQPRLGAARPPQREHGN